ncbi:flagellar motor switch protein FliG [Salinisphaera sp. Q1T1-3]|uniref:flagellar motor switch protein FliG n=1 Tax=Salinisphaera sp. Q1T1-3 TaxID=2321229 RepID=UPI000E75B2A8|nr:flagellar motor switch protein FliG [Salinisphaera sp. Q1T1-3]RJS95151.1 flagellar motor switch protein FliG [Salinisphaera sp. Q1T1-3]
MSSAESGRSGLDRSAILMMAMDDDTAAEVFKHLSNRDAQQLGVRMAALRNISNEQIEEVLQEFSDELDQYGAININGSDHIRSVLVKAMGEERAASLLEDIFETSEGSGIDALNMMEANVVAEMIRDEHPQIIATIIVHLDRNQAADVLLCFDDRLRNDVILRVATFSGVQPAALAELTEVLGSLLDGQNLKRSKMGGVSTAAEILNLLNASNEEAALASVRAHDEGLAQRIIDEMFVFEDLEKADNRTMQRILTELDNDTLAVALKGTSDALFARFTANMATRAADLLREDMEMRGPVRLSQVETERKRILDTVRRLADTGEIALGGDDDEYV